jgi:hypothetical protein
MTSLIVGAIIIVAGFHLTLSYLSGVSFLKQFAGVFKIADYVVIAMMAFTVVMNVVFQGVEWRKALAAHKASDQVAEVLRSQSEGRSVSEISTEEVLASVKQKAAATGVNEDQLKRLVEQHTQDLLFNDKDFEEKLNPLIVTYLQPLPRNAKRVLNRLKVNLLIAYKRKLFEPVLTPPKPKVEVDQICKWLVLAERWPQLRRALAAVPDEMGGLEKKSVLTVNDPKDDPFMSSIKVLSPYYEGDEDLREFIQSTPKLANVLERLSSSD